MKFCELKNNFDKKVDIQGFVDKVRDLQYVQFVILRNGNDKVQVTIEKNDNNKELNDKVSAITLESTVKVYGKVIESHSVKLNGMEIIPESIEITSKSLEELPVNIQKKDATSRDTRLDYRFLDLRREDNYLLFKCQTLIEKAMRDYFINKDYIEIHSPKISESNAESGAEQFKLDYFGKKACLVQSPQFYKQMAIASGFGNVFEVGPVYRAENSNTATHTTEFHGFDVEMGFINSVDDVMDEEEAWIKYFLKELKNKYEDEVKKTFKVDIPNLDVDFPRLTFDKVKCIMREEFHYDAEKKDDLDSREEKLICKYVKKKYDSDFVFVTNYPYSARSFYVMKDEDGITQTYDLLFRGVEITSGAQREHRPDILEKQIKEKGINPKDLDFYINFFRYGCPPHGGFGVGLERVMMCIFNIDNIREVSYIFRGPTRLNP